MSVRRKRIILSLCICLLWCATAYAYEEEFPTRTTFSVGWTQWAKQLAAGMKTTGDAALSLSKSQGMDAEQLSSLQAVLEQLDIGFHLQYGEADAGLQGVDFSLAQTPWISLVQAQQEGLIGVRVSTLPEVWLTLPAEAGATRDQAGARLTDVLGMEIDWLPSLGAYFEKPLSSAPRPWQIFDAQWRAFQCLCTDYADEGAENRGLSGMDAQSHCTTYLMDTAALQGALGEWLAAFKTDAMVQEQLCMLSAVQREDVLLWLNAQTENLQTWSLRNPMRLRVYLDGADEVCGATAEATVQSEQGSTQLSMRYTRKTRGTKQTHVFNLGYQPGGRADGIKAKVTYITNANEKGRAARSLTSSVSGYLDRKAYALKLSFDYENLWTQEGDARLVESITGDGQACVQWDEEQKQRLSWQETSETRSDRKMPDAFAARRKLDFSWEEGERTVAEGTLDLTMHLEEPSAFPSLIGEDAVFLNELPSERLQELAQQARSMLADQTKAALRALPIAVAIGWLLP